MTAVLTFPPLRSSFPINRTSSVLNAMSAASFTAEQKLSLTNKKEKVLLKEKNANIANNLDWLGLGFRYANHLT